MSRSPLTSEQKLDEIYRILKKQESRSSITFGFKLLKWAVILVVVFLVASHPTFLLEKFVEYLTPMITENMKSVLESQGSGILDQFKSLIPADNPFSSGY